MPWKPKHPCYACRRTLTHDRYCDPCEATRHKAYNEERGKARQFYSTKAWRLKREEHLIEHPDCQHIMPDGQCCASSLKPEVDHKTPRGKCGTNKYEHDNNLICEICDRPGNLKTLCKRHHSAKTAKENRIFGRELTIGESSDAQT